MTNDRLALAAIFLIASGIGTVGAHLINTEAYVHAVVVFVALTLVPLYGKWRSGSLIDEFEKITKTNKEQ